MYEVQQLCLRLLGDPEAAAQVAETTRGQDTERTTQLRHALEACREREVTEIEVTRYEAGGGDLADTVAGEVAEASARLDSEQREALALSGLLGLDHAEVAATLELEPEAVPALLAESRMALRALLRDTPVRESGCPDRDRTLHTATLRQDSEPVAESEEDWLLQHLGSCTDCARVHAAMLEGAASYRTWRA